MNKTSCFVFLFCIPTISLMILSLTSADEQQQKESLRRLKNKMALDPELPPMTELGEDLNVNLFVGPFVVLDLDDASQTMSFTMNIIMTWRDDNLAWEPRDYSNITKIHVALDTMWRPSVAMINGVIGSSILESTVPLVIRSHGLIIWQDVLTTASSCKTELSQFPFDEQTCQLIFTPLTGYDVKLNPSINPSHYHINIESNGEWDVLNLTTSSGIVTLFTVTLRRKTQFYILNLIFPMALLSLVNSLVFLLPSSSGEKMSFLMAVFVSNTVFLTLIHDRMPSTSDSICNLSLYLVLIQVQGFLAIVATIVVQNIYHRRVLSEKGHLIGRCVKVAPIERVKLHPDSTGDEDEMNKSQKIKKILGGVCGNMFLDRILDGILFVFFLVGAVVSFVCVFVRK